MKWFESILEVIQKGEFLPQDFSGNIHYIDGDSKNLYEKNLLKMPDDWEYRNKIIKYTTNKEKYRTIEFDKVDWASSIVLFGCSNVFGIGLDDKDTISHNLSNLSSRPVINMGSPGTSIKHCFHNNLILKNHYSTPYAVINLWPIYSRDMKYSEKSILNVGSWNYNFEYAKAVMSDDYHLLTEGYQHITATRNIWDTKYIDLTLFKENIKYYNLDYVEIIDKARDLLHPGSQTSKLVAEYIMSRL